MPNFFSTHTHTHRGCRIEELGLWSIRPLPRSMLQDPVGEGDRMSEERSGVPPVLAALGRRGVSAADALWVTASLMQGQPSPMPSHSAIEDEEELASCGGQSWRLWRREMEMGRSSIEKPSSSILNSFRRLHSCSVLLP